MCNAYNHPPGCTCGFGGEGHLGGGGYRSYRNSSYFQFGMSYTSYESFVTPNAICPVCGAKVFFYQNENGSRVFFDELGPPWPKHPCTDRQISKVKPLLLSSEGDDELGGVNDTNWKRFEWKENGWEPVYFERKKDLSPDFLEFDIILMSSGDKKKIYVKKISKRNDGCCRDLNKGNIGHIRKFGENIKNASVWVVSYLDRHGNPAKVLACDSMIYVSYLPDLDMSDKEKKISRKKIKYKKKRDMSMADRKKKELRGKERIVNNIMANQLQNLFSNKV